MLQPTEFPRTLKLCQCNGFELETHPTDGNRVCIIKESAFYPIDLNAQKIYSDKELWKFVAAIIVEHRREEREYCR